MEGVVAVLTPLIEAIQKFFVESPAWLKMLMGAGILAGKLGGSVMFGGAGSLLAAAFGAPIVLAAIAAVIGYGLKLWFDGIIERKNKEELRKKLSRQMIGHKAFDTKTKKFMTLTPAGLMQAQMDAFLGDSGAQKFLERYRKRSSLLGKGTGKGALNQGILNLSSGSGSKYFKSQTQGEIDSASTQQGWQEYLKYKGIDGMETQRLTKDLGSQGLNQRDFQNMIAGLKNATDKEKQEIMLKVEFEALKFKGDSLEALVKKITAKYDREKLPAVLTHRQTRGRPGFR